MTRSAKEIVQQYALSVSRISAVGAEMDDQNRKEWRKRMREERVRVPYIEFLLWKLYKTICDEEKEVKK